MLAMTGGGIYDVFQAAQNKGKNQGVNKLLSWPDEFVQTFNPMYDIAAVQLENEGCFDFEQCYNSKTGGCPAIFLVMVNLDRIKFTAGWRPLDLVRKHFCPFTD